MKSKIIAVLCALVCSTAVFGQGYDESYEAYQGDYNNDGYTDFYIRKPGIVILHGEIATPIVIDDLDGFVLQQNQDQTFTTQATTIDDLSQWQPSSVELVFQDFNMDGVVDVLLKGVSDVIYGVFDQIVFANSVQNGAPVHVRAVDEGFQQFFKDALYWTDNPNYFYQEENFLGNYCVEGYWLPIYGYYYDYYYDNYVFGVVGYYLVCTQYAAIYDGSIFHPKAIGFAQAYSDVMDSGILNPQSAEGQVLADLWEDIFGTQVDFDYLPSIVHSNLDHVWQGAKNLFILVGIGFNYCDISYDSESGVDNNLIVCFDDFVSSPPDCQTSTYAITGTQEGLSMAGNRREFWESRRMNSCDPIGWTAIRIIEDKGFGRVTNRWLRHVADEVGVTLDEEELGVSVMEKHVDVTNQDDKGILHLLSPKQVADYHHDVFGAYNLPSYTFGGSPFGTESHFGFIWCKGCDSSP